MRLRLVGLALLGLVLFACSDDSTSNGSGQDATPSVTAAPSGAAAISEPVGRLVAAVEAKDSAALSSMLRFITTPCTDAQGVGGPPKCWLGGRDTKGEGAPTPFPSGTPVEVFPLASCEFGWYEPAAARDLVQSTLPSVGELITVLRLTQPMYTETDTTYPQAQYAVAYVRRASGSAERLIVYAVDASGVTHIDLPCTDDMRQALELSPLYRAAEVVVAGPAAAKVGITPVPTPTR